MITVGLNEKVLLSMSEATALFGIGKNTLIQLLKGHPELGVKIGRAQRVKREAMAEYIQNVVEIEPFDFKENKKK